MVGTGTRAGVPRQGWAPASRRLGQPAPRLHTEAPFSSYHNQNEGTQLLMEKGLGCLTLQLLPVIFWPPKAPCGTQGDA